MISQYERGLRNPKIETIDKIALALDISIFQLKGNLTMEEFDTTESCKQIERLGNAKDGIIAILTEIYGHVESKDVMCDSPFTGHYYLVGDDANAFILYDGDLDALLNSTKASLPALVERMKDSRSELEVIRDYADELNAMPPPEGK